MVPVVLGLEWVGHLGQGVLGSPLIEVGVLVDGLTVLLLDPVWMLSGRRHSIRVSEVLLWHGEVVLRLERHDL